MLDMEKRYVREIETNIVEKMRLRLWKNGAKIASR